MLYWNIFLEAFFGGKNQYALINDYASYYISIYR